MLFEIGHKITTNNWNMQGFSEKSPNLFEVFAENACNSHDCANVTSAGTHLREGRRYDNICSNLFLIVI
jgi:hypothetical protein